MQIARCDCSRARTELPESQLRTNDGDAFNSKEVDFAGEVTDDCVEKREGEQLLHKINRVSAASDHRTAQQTLPRSSWYNSSCFSFLQQSSSRTDTGQRSLELQTYVVLSSCCETFLHEQYCTDKALPSRPGLVRRAHAFCRPQREAACRPPTHSR